MKTNIYLVEIKRPFHQSYVWRVPCYSLTMRLIAMRASDANVSPRTGRGTSSLAEPAYWDGRGDISVSVSSLPKISEHQVIMDIY